MVSNKKIMVDPLKKLKQDFAQAFHSSTNLVPKEIDAKHHHILNLAYAKENWLGEIDWNNLRNWEGQNDLGIPSNFRSDFFIHGWKSLIFFPAKKITRMTSDHMIRGSLKDDLKILEEIGAYEILKRIPMPIQPATTSFWNHGGVRFNMRWLRYVYLAKRIESILCNQVNPIWIDIGSFYGGLQFLVKHLRPDCTLILVDFEHQLFRSYAFLKSHFPKLNHSLSPSSLRDLTPGSISYVAARNFNNIEGTSVSLITNFFSFGEMPPNTMQDYLSSRHIQNAKYLYFVNRWVSNPWFEPTYKVETNVTNYILPHFSIRTMDVMPMHHYQSIKRMALGTVRYRNSSSSYFEILQERVVD
jgi:putative sugar O-methyltransferase